MAKAGPDNKPVRIKTSIESALVLLFLNLKNNPSVKGKRLETMTRSYLKAVPNEVNARKNSVDEISIIWYIPCCIE